MKYKFFGTAAAEGIPAMYCECKLCNKVRELGGKDVRTRSQSLIDDKILIDYPADTYMHIINGLPLHKIHTYLITHSHSDHLYTEDFCMLGNWFATRTSEEKVHIYSYYASHFACLAEIGRSNLSNRMESHAIKPFEPFMVEGYKITALKAEHGPHTTPVIFLVEKDGKCVLHSSDTGYYPRETWEYLEKNKVHIDFAAFDCTEALAEKDNDEKGNHMNFATVLHVKKNLEKLGWIDDKTLCCINHFSHNCGLTHKELEELASKEGFFVSYDGMEIEI